MKLDLSVGRGTKTLLLGSPGSGKTYSINTLIKAGLEVAVIITDPDGDVTLLDAVRNLNLPRNKLHLRYISAAASSWDALKDSARRINLMDYKSLTEIKAGIAKDKYGQFLDLLDCLSNFRSDDGVVLGPVDSWGPERALVIDSLSGLNMMAMALMIGGKPAAHQGEWGVAMNAEEQLIYKLCADLKCFFVLTSHLDKEMDEVLGKPQFMAAALGRKLAPKLPRLFSDVILAYREGDRFWWSTSAVDVDLKTRTLPLRSKIDPDFGQIVEAWRKRNDN